MSNKNLYIKNIKKIFPIHSKKEKEYLKKLERHISEYIDDYPNPTYDELVEKFGTPKEVFMGYIDSQEEGYLIQKMNTKRVVIVLSVIVCSIVLSLCLWKGYLFYKGYQEAMNEKVTTIEIEQAVEE